MAQRSVKAAKAGTARIAILGATTQEGVALRESLTEARVSGSRVDLFGYSEGEAQLSEYAGEARLIQPPELTDICDHDVIFVCESGPILENLLKEPSRSGVVVDLVGAIPAEMNPALVHLDLNPDDAKGQSLLGAPHPLTLMLARVLGPLERVAGLRTVVATILQPAADFGKQAITALREQTIQLLSFNDVTTEIFGRQLAFNVVPNGDLSCKAVGEAALVRDQMMRLMRWDRPRLALARLAVPVFFGHGIQLNLQAAGSFDISALQEALGAAGVAVPGEGGGVVTPLDTVGEKTLQVVRIEDDGADGVAMWVVAGEAPSQAASHAVNLARLVRPI